MTDRRNERRNVVLLASAGLFSALYLVLAIRFATRIWSSDLNSSARGFFMSALVTTIVLYAIAVVMAFSQRHRSGAALPVALAAIFGCFVCLVFFGP